MATDKKVHVIGAGLAGSEAAWQIVKRGVEGNVTLHPTGAIYRPIIFNELAAKKNGDK